jgi:hypothetical protein
VRRITFAIALLILLRAGCAAEPWLLQFPEISFDDKHVYFCGEQWCGYLSGGLEAMLTVPRDSVNPPAPPPEAIMSVLLSGDEYVARDNQILLIHPPLADTAFTLTEPSIESLQILEQLIQPADRPHARPRETTGPITASRSRVFFGLQLYDPITDATLGGIGWIDPASRHIARLYSAALARMEPVWIAAIGDTIHALFAEVRDGERVRTKWIRCDATHPELAEVDLAQNSIPGERILAMYRWHETIVLSTDAAIAIHSARQTIAWDTRTYAPSEGSWLYMRKFTSPGKGDTTRFFSFPKGRPTVVKAWIGDWVEVGAPEGIQAYIGKHEWVADSASWTKPDWGCDKPCFARIRIPTNGKFMEGDVTNTPLTLIGVDRNGAKIGFRAGWIPARRLVPVLLPVR